MIYSRPNIFSIDFYRELLRLVPEEQVICLILPDASYIESILDIVSRDDVHKNSFVSISGNTLPMQAKTNLKLTVQGEYRIILFTAESFTYWFGVDEVDPVINQLKEKINLTIMHAGYLSYPGSYIYKERYYEASQILSKQEWKTVVLSNMFSEEMQRYFLELFPLIRTQHLKMFFPWVRLQVLYEFSRHSKKKQLIESLQSEYSQTLVCMQSNASESDISTLCQELSKYKLRSAMYVNTLDLEQKSSAIEKYLAGECCLVTNQLPCDLPFNPNIKKLIMYSQPRDLLEWIDNIAFVSESVKEVQIITCEDDCFQDLDHRQALLAQRNGFKLDSGYQKKLVLSWITNTHICHWRYLEKILLGHSVSGNCGICNVCSQEFETSWLSYISQWMVRYRHKIKLPEAIYQN